MKSVAVFLSAILMLSAGCAKNFQDTAPSPNNFRSSFEKSMPNPEDMKKNISGSEGSDARSLPEHAFALCEKSRKFQQKGDRQKALEVLDQAYSLIPGIREDDDPDIIQQKEDMRVMISKRILEICASEKMTAAGKNKAISMTMNSYVREEIAVLMRREKTQKESFFIGAYRRSGKYRPFILKELRKAGLPEELSWLPLIESGFRANALSPARALGLWQFIHSTGSRFGLKQNRYVDERLDPEKATKAAIAYLKELHDIFGDWTTALAAYNCGEGRVLSVIRQQNADYLNNFWDLYKDLPEETARYVPRFLAALHIVANPKKYGIDEIVPYSPPKYEIVKVSDRFHLKDAAAASGISTELLKELNPELRCNVVPGERYPLKVPPNTGEILLSKRDEISEKTLFSESEPPGLYRRRSHIPESSGTSVRRTVPAPESFHVKPEKAFKPSMPSKHEVKKGETLWAIARQYDMTLNEIAQLNSLPDITVRLGQVLSILPKKNLIADNSEKSLKKERSKTYQVKHGDVAFQIAKRHNISLDRLLEMNRLSDAGKIYPGQTLHLDE